VARLAPSLLWVVFLWVSLVENAPARVAAESWQQDAWVSDLTSSDSADSVTDSVQDSPPGDSLEADGMEVGPNLYAYVMQNPWTAWDPEGLETKTELEDARNRLDSGYQEQVRDINGMKDISRGERDKEINSLNDRYKKARNGIDDRLGKIEGTARDMASVYGGKADDYYAQLDDSKANVQQLMGLMQHLDDYGLRGNAVDAMRGDVGGLAISIGKGVLVDRALRSVKLLKLLNKAPKFTKSSLQLGQQMHKAYKTGLDDGINTFKEFRLPSGKRIDFLDIANGVIHELKPNNPRAMKAGQVQLQGYLKELQSMPQFQGINWSTVLDTY
jgi:uncharacterized protein YukE